MTQQPYRRDEGMTDLPDIPSVSSPDANGEYEWDWGSLSLSQRDTMIAGPVLDLEFSGDSGEVRTLLRLHPGDLIRLAHWLTCEAVARTLAEPDQREGAYQAAGAAFARAFGPKPKKPA
jgi:hypothetical protein